MGIKIETANGSVTLSAEDGSGNIDVEIPRAGWQEADADLSTLSQNGIGTGANQIVQLDGSARLPGVDGSQLTGIDSLPTQSGHSGKYLTTNGTSPTWADVDSLPSQSGNSGKYLTTNGTTSSWSEVDAASIDGKSIEVVASLPSSPDANTIYLTQDNGTALPAQTGQSGKFLTTDGSTASWAAASGGGGGGWTEIASQTITANTATLTFSSLNLSAYSVVRLEMIHFRKNNNLYTRLSLSNDGFSTYEVFPQNCTATFDNTTSSYDRQADSSLSGGIGEYLIISPHNLWNISGTGHGVSGVIDFTVNQPRVIVNGSGICTDDGSAAVLWTGQVDCTTFTDLKIENYSGNFVSGKFRLLGMA